MNYKKRNFWSIVVLVFIFSSCMPQPHFTIKEGLFDQSQADDLGLGEVSKMETFTIYVPTDSTDKKCEWSCNDCL